ncbi:MAG: helix-turn-helix transcriptional regulator [Oscillospiraceae bacterium]|nr:helix-turn-helix transcriptional regulator [Oscillospiraceae bacterium]
MEEQLDRRFTASGAGTGLVMTHLTRRFTTPGTVNLTGGAEYRLLFLQRGSAVCGDKQMNGATCLLLKPGQTLPCRFTDEGVICGFGFRGEDAERLYDLICRSLTVPVVTHPAPQDLLQTFDAATSLPDTAAGDTRRTGLLYLVLSGLIPEDAAQEDEMPYGKSALIYMRENYTRPISVGDVAKAVGVSRSWLYRCFIDYTEQSPAMYLRSLRMERAKSLLRLTSLSVQEIAFGVGYEDALYFSRVFSSYTGTTPSRYRKNP